MKQRLIDANEVLLTKDERILGYTDVNAALKLQMMKIVDAPTIEAIPIEWIVDWLTKQHIPATHTCDDYYAVEMMLGDWEKENE